MLKWMNRHAPAVLLGLAASCSGVARGAVVFSENWNSGTIDSSKWTVTDSTVVALDNLGGGDYALALRGSDEAGATLGWGDHIYGKSTYNRGDTLRCTFRVWYKSSTNVQGGFHGPWHFNDTSPVYSNQEACVDYLYADFRRGEGGPTPIQSGPSLTGLNSAWPPANTKNGSIVVRVTLGDTRGMKVEYSTDNGSTFLASANGDTIGTGAGITTTGLRLGFGPHAQQAGTVYVDDIVVETGALDDGPATLPADIRDLTQHFEDPLSPLTPWRFIPTSNISSVSVSRHPGLAQVYIGSQQQDVKGILNAPIPIGTYTLPWEFQLGMQNAFNVLTGRSSKQVNTAAGLHIALTFSNPNTWPPDRTQTPPNTHTFDLLNVHLGNYGEVGTGLPQLVSNTNIYRPPGDATQEAYLLYGRGDMGNSSVLGDWKMPYIWIGDGAKYAGPASSQIYYRFILLSPTQFQVGVKFDASHGWSMKTVNVGSYGNITGVWEVGPIISGDRWIPDTLAPALGITQPPNVDAPDPAMEYYVEYCAFLRGIPRPFEHYSDEFNVKGYMGQWQIQEQNTLVDTYSNPGYMSFRLTGSGAGTGIAPAGGPNLSLTTYPPPWEVEVCYIPPPDTVPWNFYYALVARGTNPSNYVIYLPGVENDPSSHTHRVMTGVGGESPFQPHFSSPVPESILSARPLYMIFQMVDTETIRIGFKGGESDPWYFSDPYDTSATMPGGAISYWELGDWSTTTNFTGGPTYEEFKIDYIRYRTSLSTNDGAKSTAWKAY